MNICIFCGSRPGKKPVYTSTAVEMGTQIAALGHTLIYGGGKVGLMGTIADAALKSGGKVTGILPSALFTKEVAHTSLTEFLETETMSTRKVELVKHSDAFIALPGGAGTLDELFEVLTLMQIGELTKPIGILNVEHFYDNMLTQLAHMVQEGFVDQEHVDMIIVEPTVDALLTRICAM